MANLNHEIQAFGIADSTCNDSVVIQQTNNFVQSVIDRNLILNSSATIRQFQLQQFNEDKISSNCNAAAAASNVTKDCVFAKYQTCEPECHIPFHCELDKFGSLEFRCE